jgi:hypothetical protein
LNCGVLAEMVQDHVPVVDAITSKALEAEAIIQKPYKQRPVASIQSAQVEYIAAGAENVLPVTVAPPM